MNTPALFKSPYDLADEIVVVADAVSIGIASAEKMLEVAAALSYQARTVEGFELRLVSHEAEEEDPDPTLASRRTTRIINRRSSN